MSDEASSIASEISTSLAAPTETENPETEQVEDQSAEANEQDGFSRKFAALSRKEKEFRQERESWDAERTELEELRALKASLEQKPEPEEKMPLDYRLKRNPLETLEEMGLDYETLTELVVSGGKMSPEMQMKLLQQDLDSKYDKKYGSEIEQLKAKIQEKEESEVAEREQKAVEDFKNKISSHIQESADEYELIIANDAMDLVYDVIEEHYNETNRVLDVKEAAPAVEKYLESEAQKLLKLKKLANLSGQEKQEEKPSFTFESPNTLTNAQSAAAPKGADRKLSIEESKAKAAQLIRWND